jgi:hypothetical protein
MTCHFQSIVLWVGWSVVGLATALAFFFTRHRSRQFGCVTTFIVLFIVFVWMSQTAPAIGTSVPRGWQRETVRRMQQIAQAMTRTEVGRRRPASVAELGKLTRLPLEERDAWGTAFYFRAEESRYVLISFGQCGQADREDPWTYPRGETQLFTDDTVLISGSFVRLPPGIRVE